MMAIVLPFVLVLAACSKPVPTEEPVRAVKVLTVGVAGIQSGAEFAGEVRAAENQSGIVALLKRGEPQVERAGVEERPPGAAAGL